MAKSCTKYNIFFTNPAIIGICCMKYSITPPSSGLAGEFLYFIQQFTRSPRDRRLKVAILTTF
jgi:hypothetical protein